MYSFIGNKTIYLSLDKCYSYRVVNNQVIRSIEESLSCDEHEADTRIIYSICQISVDAQVVVCCSDSDILIIFLGNLDHLNASLKLWIQWGVGNHERLISINDLYQDLCISLPKALPCFHAITGCDYTPAFFRKSKLRPFKLLEKSVEYQLACQEIMTDDDNELERIFATLEKFICHMYGVPNSSNDNDHLLRVWYVTKFWRNAHLKNPSSLSPLASGWIVNDDKYDFVWYAGEQFPSSVADIVIKKPTLLENQNTKQDDDYDDIDNNGSSDNDDDYEDVSVFSLIIIDKAWRAVTPLTIHSWFKKSGFPSPNLVDVDDTLTEFNTEPSLWEALPEQDLTFGDYMLVDTDIALWGALSDAEIVTSDHNNTESDEESEELTPVTLSEAKMSLNKLRNFSLQNHVDADIL
ncbi:uncharacterized protein TNCV_1530751 [Trichonephila clavipes]|nr:uncharacterized protein TNCV_1530751 [Trichonephila clavipes]